MENFVLNKNNKLKEFHLNSSESFIRIIRISLILEDSFDSSWSQLISKLSINAALKYVVYEDEEGRFIDDRKHEFPINLPFDLNRVKPIFDLNQIIKNEKIQIGGNPQLKFYTDLKFELEENSLVEENYSLQFTVELFDTINK